MNIVVCVKPVPAKSIIDEKGNPVREKKNIINSSDKNAIEEALRIKEKNGGIITTISMTIKNNEKVLKEIIAFGVDKTVMLNDANFSGSDTNATSYILFKAIRKLKNVDLIICGNSTTDSNTSQVGIEIAAKLNIPYIYNVTEIIKINNNKIICRSKTNNGYIDVEATLPALITVGNKINIPRIPTVENRFLSKNKKIIVWSAVDIKADLSRCGIKGSPTKVINTEKLKRIKDTTFINGSIDEQVDRIYEIIKNLKQKNNEIKFFEIVKKITDKEIWVYIENNEVSLEVLSIARKIANELDANVVAITFDNKLRDKLGFCGSDKIIFIENNQYNYYEKSLAILELLKNNRPDIFLFGKSYESKNISSYIAGKLDLGLSADCIDLKLDKNNKLIQIRSAYGGTLLAHIVSNTIPEMATILPYSFNKIYNSSNIADIITKKFDIKNADIFIKRKISEKKKLFETAEIIIAGGMGIASKNSFDNLEKLAKLLNAEIGTTRDAVDKGFAKETNLIGQSGMIINTNLYIAFGIRGAIEHSIGIKSDIVISVNTDRNALINKISDYSIIADANVFIEKLIDKLEIGDGFNEHL